MKIAYLVSEYPKRSHTFIKREIDVLRSKGFTIAPFSLHRCSTAEVLNPEEQSVYDETVAVFPVSIKRLLRAHLRCFFSTPINYLKLLGAGFRFAEASPKGLLYTLFYFAEAIYLVEKMCDQDIDLIHVHFANSGAKVGAIVARYLEVPWVISLHGDSDFGYPVIQWLGSLVRDAALVRCVSDFGAAQVKRLLPREDFSKVFVAYSGLPTQYGQRFSQQPLDNIQLHNPVRLLSVGRLSPEKGQSLLIELAKKLTRQNVSFVIDIVGDGSDRQTLEQLCQSLSLHDVITFHGAVQEMEVFDHMTKADIFVCPSFMEGLPQVLMESMLAGTPTVAPCVAGIPELVEPGKTGMLYPVGNVEKMALAVLALVEDPELYSQIAKAGRRTVVDHFLMDTTVLPLQAQLEQLAVR